jgi:2-oxoglutarate ferredoxin oxidoreductase subunit alpha
MVDFVKKGFDVSFKYRNPVMILADGAIGQMMEKVELFDQVPRDLELKDWATTGKVEGKDRVYITSLFIKSEEMEQVNLRLQRKYREIEKNEVMFETFGTEDAEYIFTGYGLGARICKKTMELGREKGYKIGLIRPITVYPFPYKAYEDLASNIKGILDVEMNAGQMVEDVRLAVRGKTRVEFYGRMGGMIPSPDDILEYFEETFIKGGK